MLNIFCIKFFTKPIELILSRDGCRRKNIFGSWFASGKLFLNNGFEEKQGNNIFIRRYFYLKYFKRVAKKKGGRTRKRKEDKTQLFKSLELKIGIEQEDFDAQYDDFMKICPKVLFLK